MKNWIVFQRSTFDYVDPNGDPYTSQIFLIEVATGRYIHRSQGVRVDHGTLNDLELLASKLFEAFEETRPCQGWSSDKNGFDRLPSVQYPYLRHVSSDCQYVVNPCKMELDEGHSSTGFQPRSLCAPCQKAGQDVLEGAQDFREVLAEDIICPKIEGQTETPASWESWSGGIFEDSEDFESDLFNHSMGDDDIVGGRKKSKQIRKTVKGSKRSKKQLQSASFVGGPDVDSADEAKISNKREYTCNHCSQTFPTISYYRRHQREKRKLSCKECDKEVTTFFDLKKHIAAKHPDSMEGIFSPLWTNDEDEETIKVPKVCFLCDRVFNGSVLLYRHKELYHEMGDQKCSDCQEPCLTFYDLMIHNYQSHSKAIPHLQPFTRGLEIVRGENGKIEKKRIEFACQFCPAGYKYDSSYTLHMRKCHAWGLFECKSCDEVGHYAQDVSSHMVTFHPDNPEVKCPNCSQVLSLKDDPGNFLHHYNECKTPCSKRVFTRDGGFQKMSFQCQYCGKGYASKIVFRGHVKRHEGIERFKCTFCDYGSNIKSVLIDHEKTHLRERGLTNEDAGIQLYYNCEECGKKFRQSSSVRAHKKRVHQGIKKSYGCQDCGEIFTNLQAFYRHKREKHGHVSKSGRRGRKSDISIACP
eukprot:TCALIF_07435-PA protein Name:"Similar to ZNF878 Zinc finger protein 878 (Homo sapiens)" AED:0.54 eAED:0.54 QI:0/0/0/0.5/1/1/2/0/638